MNFKSEFSKMRDDLEWINHFVREMEKSKLLYEDVFLKWMESEDGSEIENYLKKKCEEHIQIFDLDLQNLIERLIIREGGWKKIEYGWKKKDDE